jgi:hypothetical protein
MSRRDVFIAHEMNGDGTTGTDGREVLNAVLRHKSASHIQLADCVVVWCNASFPPRPDEERRPKF